MTSWIAVIGFVVVVLWFLPIAHLASQSQLPRPWHLKFDIALVVLGLAVLAVWQAVSHLPSGQSDPASVVSNAPAIVGTIHNPLDDYHPVTCVVEGTDTVIYTGPPENAPKLCHPPATPVTMGVKP